MEFFPDFINKNNLYNLGHLLHQSFLNLIIQILAYANLEDKKEKHLEKIEKEKKEEMKIKRKDESINEKEGIKTEEDIKEEKEKMKTKMKMKMMNMIK